MNLKSVRTIIPTILLCIYLNNHVYASCSDPLANYVNWEECNQTGSVLFSRKMFQLYYGYFNDTILFDSTISKLLLLKSNFARTDFRCAKINKSMFTGTFVVTDFRNAILNTVLLHGRPGSTFKFGSDKEVKCKDKNNQDHKHTTMNGVTIGNAENIELQDSIGKNTDIFAGDIPGNFELDKSGETYRFHFHGNFTKIDLKGKAEDVTFSDNFHANTLILSEQPKHNLTINGTVDNLIVETLVVGLKIPITSNVMITLKNGGHIKNSTIPGARFAPSSSPMGICSVNFSEIMPGTILPKEAIGTGNMPERSN